LSAATAAFTLQQEFGSTGADGLRTTYGVYLLAARQIWAPRCGSAECNGLAHPPSDSSAFGELGDAVIRSDRFAMILDDGAQSVANDADKIE